MVFRALERIDPRAVFGRPWAELSKQEQLSLVGYDKLRRWEEAQLRKADFEARARL